MKKLILITMLILHVPVFHQVYALSDDEIEEFDIEDEEEDALEDEMDTEEEIEEVEKAG